MIETTADLEVVEPPGIDLHRIFLQLWVLLGLGLLLAQGMERPGHGDLDAAAAGLQVSPEQAREALRWVRGEALPECVAAAAGMETLQGLMAALLCSGPALFRTALLPLLVQHLVRLALQQTGHAGTTFRDLRAWLVAPVLARLAGPREVRERCRKMLSRAFSTAWLAEEARLGADLVRRLCATDLDRLAPRPDLGDICAELRVAATTGEEDTTLKRRLHRALGEAPAERADKPVSQAGLMRAVTEADRACRGHGLQVRLLPLGAEVPSLSEMMKAIRPCALHGRFPGRAHCPVDRKCGASACCVASGATATWLAGLASGSQKLLPRLPSSLVPLLLPAPTVG